jgi:Flp pilus assembly protein TadG
VRRFRRDCRGASAVEFALVAPVLAALLLGGVEFGLVIYSQNTMQHATRDVARKLSVNFIDQSQARHEIRNQLPRWIGNKSRILIQNTAPNDSQTNIITVDVTVRAADAGILNLYTKMFGNWTISASVSMKQEERV